MKPKRCYDCGTITDDARLMPYTDGHRHYVCADCRHRLEIDAAQEDDEGAEMDAREALDRAEHP